MQNPHLLKVALYADVTRRGKHTIWNTDNVYYHVGLKVSEYICQSLGCVVKVVLAPDGQIGLPLANGSWTGMVGMVRRGEADIAVSEIGITELRSRGVDFSYPYVVADVSFATQKPTFRHNLTTEFEPFYWQVWCCLAAFHVAMPLLFYARFQGKHSFSKIVVTTFGTILGQQAFKRLEKSSERMLALLWMVAMMVMGIVYKAQLLSILTFPSLTGVRHISELSAEIEKGRYDSSCYPGSFYVDTLLKSPDRSLQVIGANLYKNNGTRDIEKYLDPVGTVGTAFIGTKQEFLFLKNKHFISKDVFFNELQAIVIRKDFCCKQKVDGIVQKMYAGGLYDKFLKDENFKKMLRISNFLPAEEKTVTSLSLLHLDSVFYLMFFGYILAFLSLVGEVIISKYRVFEMIKGLFKSKDDEEKARSDLKQSHILTNAKNI